jgi:hypothetical protein
MPEGDKLKMEEKCVHLADFLNTEMAIIRRHLDEHIFLRHLGSKNEAIQSFINDYGWLMRELYCTKVCADREQCKRAQMLNQFGDLLRLRSSANTVQEDSVAS